MKVIRHQNQRNEMPGDCAENESSSCTAHRTKAEAVFNKLLDVCRPETAG